MKKNKIEEVTIPLSTVMTLLYGTSRTSTAKSVSVTMNKRLNKSLKSSNVESTTTIYRGVFFADGTSIFCGMLFGNAIEAPRFNFEAPNGESKKTVIIGNTASKRKMRKFLNDYLDVSEDEVMCIVKTSYSIDGELEVKGTFAGDLRGYRLRQVDTVDTKSTHEACNHIATTAKKGVAA